MLFDGSLAFYGNVQITSFLCTNVVGVVGKKIVIYFWAHFPQFTEQFKDNTLGASKLLFYMCSSEESFLCMIRFFIVSALDHRKVIKVKMTR